MRAQKVMASSSQSSRPLSPVNVTQIRLHRVSSVRHGPVNKPAGLGVGESATVDAFLTG